MKQKILKLFLILMLVAYTVFLAYVLFLRYRSISLDTTLNERIETEANFTPLETVKNYYHALKDGRMSDKVFFENIIGNLLLFLPVGVILPSCSHKFSKASGFLFFILAVILLVEGAQLLTGLGRFDTDDIILNFTGAVFGYFVNLSIRKAD